MNKRNCARPENHSGVIVMARNPLYAALLTGLALLCSAPLLAADEPDFSGYWRRINDEPFGASWPENLPYTEEGRQAEARRNTEEDGIHNCMIGFGRTLNTFAREILQDADRITILYDYDSKIRRIYMDGRGHPEDFRPTMMGHSIGRWEDSTLVIETIGMLPDYIGGASGYPHSGEATVIERMSLVEGEDGEEIRKTEITVIDPLYYTESWTGTVHHSRVEAGSEYECVSRPYIWQTGPE